MSSTDKPVTMPDKPMVDNGPAIPDNLPALLQRAAQALPSRFRIPTEDRAGHYANACGTGANWARLSFTSGPERAGWTVPTFEALGILAETCVQELEARGWDWHTHNTGPREFRRHCAQVYPNQSALSGMFQAYAPTPAQALLAALLCAVEANNAD